MRELEDVNARCSDVVDLRLALRRATTDRDRVIAAAVAAGWSKAAVGRAAGMHESRVRQIAINAGVVSPRKNRTADRTMRESDKAVALYAQGWKPGRIARLFGVSESTAFRRIRRGCDDRFGHSDLVRLKRDVQTGVVQL